MAAGYPSMTDPKTAGNLKADEEIDNSPDSEPSGGVSKDARMAGQDMIDAVGSGDPVEVYKAYKHLKQVCEAEENSGPGYDDKRPSDGKSALVVAIGKARPKKG